MGEFARLWKILQITPCLADRRNKQDRIWQVQQSKENPTANMPQKKIKNLLNRNVCIVLTERKKKRKNKIEIKLSSRNSPMSISIVHIYTVLHSFLAQWTRRPLHVVVTYISRGSVCIVVWVACVGWWKCVGGRIWGSCVAVSVKARFILSIDSLLFTTHIQSEKFVCVSNQTIRTSIRGSERGSFGEKYESKK